MFNWSINLGQIITLALTTVGFLYGLGKLIGRVDTQIKELMQLRIDFHEHVKEDRRSFDDLNQMVLKIAMGTGGK